MIAMTFTYRLRMPSDAHHYWPTLSEVDDLTGLNTIDWKMMLYFGHTFATFFYYFEQGKYLAKADTNDVLWQKWMLTYIFLETWMFFT